MWQTTPGKWSSIPQSPPVGLISGAVILTVASWPLMLLMFLVGMGGLAWMALLAVIMALEKNSSWRRRLSAPIGMLLFVATGPVLISGMRS